MKNILITGGAGGIGQATISKIIEDFSSTNIGVVDTNSDALESAKSFFKNIQNHNLEFFNSDVSSFDDVDMVVNSFKNKFGPIDCLINNAAILLDEPLLSINNREIKKLSLDNWHKSISINLSGPFYFAREVAENMLSNRTKGVIINVSSISSSGNIGQTSYSATKSALNALTVTWAQELGYFGIRVVGISPGMTDTLMPRKSMSESQLKSWINKTTLKRIIQPSEIANGILFALKNKAFTGRILEIDAGLRM